MFTNRDSDIEGMRPDIPKIDRAAADSIAEKFQNSTLRPVLKLQNELLLGVFRQYLQKRKGVFFRLSHPEQLTYIEQTVKKDQPFRNLLTGLIIGHFTLAEWEVYRQNGPELRRRLMTMLIVRIQDQVEKMIVPEALNP